MTATRPKPRPGVLDIAAYVPGKSSAPGVAKIFKLSSNETPLGPSPRAIAAYKAAADHLEDYPDGSAIDLREAIGHAFGLDPDRIVCGAGSDDLLHLLAYAYLVDGDEAIYTTHGFLIYPIVTLGAGAKPVVAPETEFTADVDAILGAGDAEDENRLPRQPEQSDRHLLVVRRGEAAASRPAAARAAGARRRLRGICPAQRLRSRHRAGGDVGERRHVPHVLENPRPRRVAARLDVRPAHIVDAINRIRGPFNVQRPAIDAGIAAIEDTEHQERSREHNTRWLAWLTEEIGKLGLEVTPSVANFVLIHFPQAPGRTAKDANAFLTKRGLILRLRRRPTNCRMRCG